MDNEYSTVNSISIIGGGTAGLVAALILKKRFPKLAVNVVRSKNIGTIGVGEGSTEHWLEFMDHMGFTHREIIQQCDATLKCGIMFKNWSDKDYLHSIQTEFNHRDGQYSTVYGSLLSKNNDTKNLTFKSYWDNTVNRWFLSNRDYFPVSQFHFNTNKLNDFLSNHAVLMGIEIFDDEILDVITSDRGIDYLVGNKQTYKSDFYIDSTGFKKILISKLGAKWIDYSKYLKMKSAVIFPTGDADNYNLWTTAHARDYGWSFHIPVYGRHGNGYIFDSDYITPEQAKQELDIFYKKDVEITKTINFQPGCLDKTWIKNCCAIGLSANFVEPLEASSIGTSIQQSFLLMHRLINYNQDIINSYNKDVSSILENIRDFIILHYKTKKNNTQFWRDLSKMDLPDSLETMIERWKRHLPIREDFNHQSRYILFTEFHHIFIMAGLDLFETEFIRQEYEMLPVSVKVNAENIIRENRSKEVSISTLTHKEFLNIIRNE
jgi:tryptophan halogenase